MGNDPKTSVIDSDHRTHDVKNLFLCDGSSLVTSGRGQPTMTIEALAFRAAERNYGAREARRNQRLIRAPYSKRLQLRVTTGAGAFVRSLRGKNS